MDFNRITQESLLNGVDFDVFDASLDEGQTRSNEPDADVRCTVFTDRGLHSKYKVQALLKTCIHGILDNESKIPASLIIVDYSLSNLEQQGRYTSVTTSFDFEPYVEDVLGLGDQQKNPLDTPNVIAYAPFETNPLAPAIQWDQSTAQESSTHNPEVAIEPEVSGVKAGSIRYSYESSGSHEQRYFSQGLAGRHFMPAGPARNIAYHVWWNMQHNVSQASGLPPKFRTAMLVTRRVEAAESKFLVRFNIAVRGGFGMRLSALADLFLRRNKPDRPILFDPTTKPVGEKLDGLEPKDGVYVLGHLAKGRELLRLSGVWGLAPLSQSSQAS